VLLRLSQGSTHPNFTGRNPLKHSLHVLIIEDNESDAILMAREIRIANGGFDVSYERVETEADMRAVLEKKFFDVVLCDYNLPSFSAEKALEILKDLELPTPFYLVSGVVSDEKADEMIRRGASDYIKKGVLSRMIPVILRGLEQAAVKDELIGIISLALDYKDQSTAGHSKRVTDLTVQLARKMKVNEVEIEHIRIGALLHDVGKIGIPDDILFKPGRLTPRERTAMEMHPQLAYDLLSRAQSLEKSLDIPYCHHEKWNGTGYPRGLMGDRIPLAARMFSVVDTYDALTTIRPYREAMGNTDALEYIKQQSGEAFDPRVVEVFAAMFDDGEAGGA
jgi:putative nucleotidyltransferase with HDIG domain